MATVVAPSPRPAAAAPGRLRRIWDSDVGWSFRHSPVAIVAAIIAALLIGAAVFAPLISPHDPYDPASIDLMVSLQPPAWAKDGTWDYPLGADNQGRDVLSNILYGSRISLVVGVAAVAFAMVLGVTLGLIAGWVGGWIGSAIMRVADVQLSFPAILVALLIEGVARGFLPQSVHEEVAIYIVIVAIGLAGWVQYARTVRASVMVERSREYVQAARVIGVHPALILIRHILPNVLGPVLVIATIHLALAVLSEATLSFLGVGVPPTQPSLGTLVRIGNDFLFSGEWWITLFPGVALALMVLSVNLLGDWLRDALNPRLR